MGESASTKSSAAAQKTQGKPPFVHEPQWDRFPPAILAMTDQRVFAPWRGEWDAAAGKLRKIPINVRTGHGASFKDQSTLCTLAEARAWVERGDAHGVNIVTGPLTRIAAVDVDKLTRRDRLPPAIRTLIDDAGGQVYIEFSPSGEGLRIFFSLDESFPQLKVEREPIDGCKEVELFYGNHFASITGLTLEGSFVAPDVTHANGELTRFIEAVFKPKPQRQHVTPELAGTFGPLHTDDAILQLLSGNEKFDKLWDGDRSDYNDNNSSADMALACLIARHSGDPAQVKRLLALSKLARDKWNRNDSTGNYLDKLVADAIAFTAPSRIAPDETMLTDASNARLFAAINRGKLLYCHPEKCWYWWSGTMWERDRAGMVMQIAKQIVLRLCIDAEQEEDKDFRTAKRRWAKSSGSLARLKAMIELAQSEPGMHVLPSAFNTNPWLLNVNNGTLDLRTGDLRPHDPANLITKLAPVEWNGLDAPSNLWLQFVARIFAGDAGLIRYVQQVLGMACTADIREQYLYIFIGAGNNGKSVMQEIILALLAEYADIAAPALLEASRFDRHPTEIKDLMNRRLIFSPEPRREAVINDTLVKQSTGESRLKARGMGEDFSTFLRTHKTIMVTNNKPRIPEDTEGMWRRIRMIPFKVVIPENERDPQLVEKLKAELPGIMAWLVRGCMDWLQHGLVAPPEVIEATADFRHEENPILEFLEEHCDRGAYEKGQPEPVRFAVSAAALWQRYAAWCQDLGRTPLKDRSFAQSLRNTVGGSLGKQSLKFQGRSTKAWTGIRFKPQGAACDPETEEC